MAYTPTINDSNYALTARSEEVRAKYNSLPNRKSSGNNTIFTDEELKKYVDSQNDTTKTDEEKKTVVDSIMSKKLGTSSPVQTTTSVATTETFTTETPATTEEVTPSEVVEKAVTQNITTPTTATGTINTEMVERAINTFNANPLNAQKVAEGEAKVKEVVEENGYSEEKAKENMTAIVKSLNEGSDNTMWYGIDKDYRTINPYDTSAKVEQTEEQKMYSELVYAGQTASIDKLYATQGQALSQFRTNAKTLSDMIWNMYGSAGTSESVDRLYGYTIDSVLSTLYNVSPTEVAKNRELYKTMSMGKNVDNKSYMEALWDSFCSDASSSLIAVNSWLYEFTDDEKYLRKIEALEEYEQRELTDYKDRGWLGETLKKTMPIVRQGLKGYLLMSLGSSIGGAIGKAVGLKKAVAQATANNAWYYLGLRGAINDGALIGGYALAGADTFVRESGSLLREIDSMVDEYGNTVPKKYKVLYATLGGLLNAIAEYATPDPIGAQISKFDFANVINRGVGSVIGNFVANSLAGALSESTEEFVQSAFSDFIKYASKEMANNYGANFDMSEENLATYFDNATSAFAEAFFPSLFAGIGGSVRGFTSSFVTKLATDEGARKDIKTTALRTLDEITTPEASTYTFKKEVGKYQNTTRFGKTITEYQLSLDSTKITDEEKATVKEKYIDDDGKLPVIEVTYDSENDKYVPVSDKDKLVGKYLYQVKRSRGFAIKVKNTENARYSSRTVSTLADNYGGEYDPTTKTLTFENQEDMDDFISDEFSGNVASENADGSVTLRVFDEKGVEQRVTATLGNVQQLKAQKEAQLETKTVTDKDGNDYEVFTDKSISRMLKSALPSMSTDEVKTLSSLIRALPANVQNDIIQKLKNGNGDIRDFIISEDMAKDEYKDNPAVLDALSKGRALSIVNDARLVLKDGKTRGKDVVHEVFHVLWNLYPEYRKNLVSALKQTLTDSGQLSQLKEFYEENKAELDTLGNTASDGSVVGKVDSWESFLDLATKASEETTVESEQGKNTSYEELFARISTVILQDPSDTALDTLPAKLKKTFETIVNKLKEIYTGLVGKSKHAPQTLEEAVLSVFNSNLDIDENGNGTRYAEEITQAGEIYRKYVNTNKWLRAPNGELTNLSEDEWCLVRTENFKKWAGDWENDPEHATKVLDNNGEPLLVYHGTARDFTVFDRGTISDSIGNDGHYGKGFYFTPDENIAEDYAQYGEGDEPHVEEVFLRIINPYVTTREAMTREVSREEIEEANGVLESEGDDINSPYYLLSHAMSSEQRVDMYQRIKNGERFDGVISADSFGKSVYDSIEYVVPNSNQIKANYNEGTFSLESDDIRYSAELDDEYMGAVNSGDVEKAREMVEERAKELGFDDAIPEQMDSYKVRTKKAPKKTIKAYKTFFVDEQGRPSALFVNGTSSIPMNVWLDAISGWAFKAENGLWYVPTTVNENSEGGKTGTDVKIPNEFVRQELIARGFLKEGSKAQSITCVAFRPGWHGGDLPFFPQGGRLGNRPDGKNKSFYNPDAPTSNYANIHRWNQVVFEVEFDADEDYTRTSQTEDGKVKFLDMQELPTDGYYKFATNPMANSTDIGGWYISGSMKIIRALSEEECNSILAENGFAPQEWEGFEETSKGRKGLGKDHMASMDLATLGYTGATQDAMKKTLAPITYDDNGNVIPLSERFNPDVNDVRYSEELNDELFEEDTLKTQTVDIKHDNGDIFNPDNPYSILNRNLKNWESLEDGDVEQLIDANVYVPEKILEKYSNLAKVTEERAERTAIDRMLEVYPQLREMAQNAKSVNNFLVQAKKIFGATIEDSLSNRLTKYYNYSQTLSPTEFSQYFVEMYGSTSTTIADLLALKKLMSTRKVAKVTEDGKKITTVIANDTELAKLLVKVNRKMTDEDARKIAKQIRKRQGRYVMDLAKTLVKMGSETAQMENVDFDPNMTSWLAIALGTEQEDLWQTALRNGTTNEEMSEATQDAEKTKQNNETFKKAIASNEESFRKIESQLEGKEIKRPSVSSLMRTINRLENKIDAQQMSKEGWQKAYYSAIKQIRELSDERRALFRKLSRLVRLDRNVSSNYEAKARRLQTILMYTDQVGIMNSVVGASLDVQKAFYTEIVQRNKARNQLRRMMKYDTKNFDSYYIDPTMKYLYKFVHGHDSLVTIADMTDNEYEIRATKQGARTDADDMYFVTYDFVAPDTDDMEQVDVEYDPNYPRIDLSNMPRELENVLWKDLADGIKNDTIQFRHMTSEDLNELRKAVSLVKHLSKMSKEAKDEAKKSRRRTRAMAVFNSQFNFDVASLTQTQKGKILERMSSDPDFGRYVLSYSDEEIEDYIRRHPETLFAENADKDKSTLAKTKDIIEVQYLKMQRVAEWMDGRENGAIYENFFRPLFESYEQEKRWINRRQEAFNDDFNIILGEGDATDRKTIKRNLKKLQDTAMFKNNTLFNGNATIKLTGWEQIGAYIYSKNIFGFIKLISSSGNNISLEEIAKINPKDTLKYIDIALAQRAQNHEVAHGKMNRLTWSQTTKLNGTDYYARDILNHVSTDQLNAVRKQIVSGQIDPKGSLSQMMMDLGDCLMKHVSSREEEVVKSGYDNYNLLTVLQENYFPLKALNPNLFTQKAQNEKQSARESKGMLMKRQLIDTYALNLNPFITFFSAIQQQEALINMSQSINDANWLMSAKGGNMKGLITQKYGSVWGNYFEDWLIMMAGAGEVDLEDMDKLLNRFIGNIAVSRVGANAMVAAKQLVSLIPAMTKGEITPKEVLQAFGKLTGKRKDAWKAFIEQQSPSTFYSAYNVEAEKSQRFDETVGAQTILADIREKTMILTEKLDGLTKGVVWIAKYEKEIKKGASIQDASFRATQLVQTTQSITDDPSLSKLQRNKNPLVRIAFMFTNDAFQTWNIITKDMPNAWKQGNHRKAILEGSGILLANAILAFLAGGWLPDDDDDEGFQWGDFLVDFGLEAIGNIPIGGTLLETAFQGYSSSFYQGADQIANLLGMLRKQGMYWITDGKEGQDYEFGDFMDRTYKSVMEGAVSLTGGPTVALERLYKALFPDGASEGFTESPTSFWYLLGSKYGKALYNGK
jgi:hypothetical protein